MEVNHPKDHVWKDMVGLLFVVILGLTLKDLLEWTTQQIQVSCILKT